MNSKQTYTWIAALMLALMFLGICSVSVIADDTDIYRPKVRHNCMILMDSSLSMRYLMYEHSVDFHAFYRAVCEDVAGDWTPDSSSHKVRDTSTSTYTYDTSATFYASAKERRRIYMIAGAMGYEAPGITGDTGTDTYNWDIGYVTDTKTYLNADGELEDENGAKPGDSGYLGRITTEVDGTTGKTMIKMDNVRLPNSKDVEEHAWGDKWPDGTQTDSGFCGLLQAPGIYFSGYFWRKGTSISSTTGDRLVTDATSCYTSNPNTADADGPVINTSSKEYDFFFVTGNYLNMLIFLNLQVYNGSSWKDASAVAAYKPDATSPLIGEMGTNISSPNYQISNYPNNNDTSYVIHQGNVDKIRIHFDVFNLYYSTQLRDRITISDASGVVYTLRNPGFYGGWTGWIDGDTATIRFITNSSYTSSGWHIDKYEYQYGGSAGSGEGYKLQNRLEVAREAIIHVIDTTRGKVNWGVAIFDGTDGADILQPINASFNDDEHRQSIINHLEAVTPNSYTPLGESLQDIFMDYKKGTMQAYRECNKSFVIVLTDGFPTADDSWARISTAITSPNFTDSAYHDSEQYYLDPFLYSAGVNDYLDDVAAYCYSHSWVSPGPQVTVDYEEGEEIPEDKRKDTPANLVTHTVGLSLDSALLKHTADVGGGINLTAYSKAQLVNAFYSLGLMIAEYSSYTAPVVSVDEANRVQSGDRLYMALFKPNEDGLWTGNLKKYGLDYTPENWCGRTREWIVVDKTYQPATDCDGDMLQNTSSFWSTGNDGGEVEKGGTGALMYAAVPTPDGNTLMDSTNATFRNIKTYIGGTLINFNTDTITNSDLGLGTDAAADLQRYKIINFMYGYTFNAYDGTVTGTTLGAPVVKSSWPMGAVIHSEPVLVDYFNSSNALTNRYIVVGSNNGVLHVFDDTNGSEKLAFVPPVILTKLNDFDQSVTDPNNKVYTVDGAPMLCESAAGDKLLIFGLRRGGRAYYALNVTSNDPDLWTVEWIIEDSATEFQELGYTYAKPGYTKIKVDETVVSGSTVNVYKHILIIPAGYDIGEDMADTEDEYELTDTNTSAMGRGIYIVDLDTGLPLSYSSVSMATSTETSGGYTQYVRPSSTWLASNTTAVMNQMRYCFPADPSILTDNDNCLRAAYITDLYGQVWKLRYVYDENTSEGKFYLDLIFKANPRTDQESAYENLSAFKTWTTATTTDPRGTIGTSTDDLGNTIMDSAGDIHNARRCFFSPEISYAGNCFTNVPVLYMGTGDREHPTFPYEENGIFAFYDAQAYHENILSDTYDNPTSLDPTLSAFYNDCFSEKDLLNVTCGAMEPDVVLSTTASENLLWKSNIYTFLKTKMMGWYINFNILSGCYGADATNELTHGGEKALSPVSLFAKVLYAPTYTPLQPTTGKDDPCSYDGFARLYALKYCDGNAAYNFYLANDEAASGDDDGTRFTRRDRYADIGSHLPSGTAIVIREGKAAGFISVGGKIFPLGELEFPLNMVPYFWRQIFVD